ncbi:nucleolar and coiled-body phosphoprotein 1-like isoform X2 [Pseudoliparis swirei]|uniref:nucleolar and coiled-body phosphoprotein 1-like isoform X2 n=1 Tax=Pseudoliparis swirei TaxID=2059687 RepID=UPI0024BD8717|nr:nucleolar and coiled-body phosphoprotein 1-like isoform X2 [Pseudoliparis swirei]
MAAETRAGLNNMSKAVMLRDVVVNKLTTAAQEIFATVERTVTGYEEEASGLRHELDRLRRQLELLAQPEIKVEPTDNLLPGGGGGGGEKLSRFDLDVEEFGIRDVISYAEEEEEGKDEEKESAESTRLDPEELRDPGPQVPVGRKGAPLKFRVGLLQNSKAELLMDGGLKSPVVKCPRGLQEPDFLDLLRSTFPQLTGPFNAFTSDSTGRSSLFIRVKAAKKTPKEKKKLRSAPRKDGEERRSSKVPEPAERLSNGTSTSCLPPLRRHTADRTPRKSKAKREGGALPAADNREVEEEGEGGSKPDENEEKSRESKAKKKKRKSRESSDEKKKRKSRESSDEKKKKRRKKLKRKRQAETERGGDLPVADNGDEKEEEEEEEKEEDLKPDENHKEPRKRRRSQGVQTKISSLGPGDPGQQTLRIKEDVMAADRGSPPGGGPSVKKKRRRCSGGAPLHRVGQDPQADPLPADGSKSPVQKPRRPRDPKDPDLLDLLRSTFPQGPPYLRVHQCTRVAGGTVQLASGKLLPVAPPRPLKR